MREERLKHEGERERALGDAKKRRKKKKKRKDDQKAPLRKLNDVMTMTMMIMMTMTTTTITTMTTMTTMMMTAVYSSADLAGDAGGSGVGTGGDDDAETLRMHKAPRVHVGVAPRVAISMHEPS